MKQRIICKGLAVAVIILFIGLAIQPSVAVQSKREINIEQTEEDNNQEKLPLFGFFCILEVYAYHIVGGHIWAPFELLKCEDLDTGKTRFRRTGFLGHKYFIALRRGHTYEISAPAYEKSVIIELVDFWNYVEIELSVH